MAKYCNRAGPSSLTRDSSTKALELYCSRQLNVPVLACSWQSAVQSRRSLSQPPSELPLHMALCTLPDC